MKAIVTQTGGESIPSEEERIAQARELLLRLMIVAGIVKIPVNRKKLRGKWGTHIPLLVPLAAALLEELPEAFLGLGFDAAALRANLKRQQLHDHVKHMLLYAAECCSDQALADRALVYDQVMAVLKTAAGTLANPGTAEELRRRMEEGSRHLRGTMERHNDRINKKRRRTMEGRQGANAQPRLGDGNEK